MLLFTLFRTPLRLVGLVVATCLFFLSSTFGQVIIRPKPNPIASQSHTAFMDEHILKADRLRKEGKNQEALAVINEALRFDPYCGQCLGLKAGIEGNLKKFREGVGDADLGIKYSKTPRNKSFSAYNKGFNLAGLGRKSEALDAYNESIRLDPTFPMGHYGKGKLLYELNDFKGAQSELDKAIQLNPTHGPSWAYQALTFAVLGHPEASLAYGNIAVQHAPNDPRSYFARAVGFRAIGAYKEMLDDATRSLELDATIPQGHLLRADALKLLGREEEAAKEYALEPNRKAVEAGLHPAPQVDLRMYNCGDFSTELQTPSNYNIDGFSDCVRRISEQLDETIKQLEALPTPAKKKTIPGLLTPLSQKK